MKGELDRLVAGLASSGWEERYRAIKVYCDPWTWPNQAPADLHALTPPFDAACDPIKNVRDLASAGVWRVASAHGGDEARGTIRKASADSRWGVRAAVATVYMGGEVPGLPLESMVTLLGDDHATVPVRAARALASMGRRGELPDSIGQDLVDALGDDEPGVRVQATLAYAALPGGHDAAPFERAGRDVDYRVRLASVASMPHGGCRVLIETLADPHAWVAYGASRRLGEVECPGRVEALLGVLTAKNRRRRLAAARALGRIGAPAAVMPLIDLFVRSTGLTVRVHLPEVLAELGDPRAVSGPDRCPR